MHHYTVYGEITYGNGNMGVITYPCHNPNPSLANLDLQKKLSG